MTSLHILESTVTHADERPAPADQAVWRQAVAYLRRGLALVRVQPWIYVLASLVYMTPALLAAVLMLRTTTPSLAHSAAIDGLPAITAVLGTLVIMMLIGRHARGQPADLARASAYGLTWVPRYLWTNAHSTVIFWVPVGLLLWTRSRLEMVWPASAGGGLALAAWLVIGGVALYLHTRTLLAPFLAVHTDLPATQAVLEAWRLSGRHCGLCLTTLLVAGLPMTVLVAALTLAVLLLLPGAPAVLGATGSALIWAAIQLVRPVLMPAIYVLYTDLWSAEVARRARTGEPPAPAPLRALLCLTRPLPRLGRPW